MFSLIIFVYVLFSKKLFCFFTNLLVFCAFFHLFHYPIHTHNHHISVWQHCVSLCRDALLISLLFFFRLMHTCVEKNCKSSHKKLLCCCFLYSFFLSAYYVIYNYMHTYIQHLLLTIIYKCRLAIKLPHKQICIHTNICT